MKVKRNEKETYDEWYARHESIERTNRGRDKVKRKVLGEKAQYAQRFTDAVREFHDQKYRKATAKLVGRFPLPIGMYPFRDSYPRNRR